MGITGGNESQGEYSDTDSGIQSLPKKVAQDLAKNIIPPNLLPLKPLVPEAVLNNAEVTKSPPKTPKAKAKKNSKTATSTEKNVGVNAAEGNNKGISARPPNIDDLIKSIQAPGQPIILPITPVPVAKINGTETTPKKKQS